jgi:uncharacterized integral membrane protein
MRNITSLITAVGITVVILIVAFQNIRTFASFIFFFGFQNKSLTLPILLIAILGMIAGALYANFLHGAVKNAAEQDDENTF